MHRVNYAGQGWEVARLVAHGQPNNRGLWELAEREVHPTKLPATMFPSAIEQR
jgi:hypothetical protein